MVLLWLCANDLRAVLWVATVPAVIAVALLAIGVDEPRAIRPQQRSAATSHAPHSERFSVAFRALLVLAALFAMARLPEAFLILRAHDAAVPLVWIPAVLILMSAVYPAASYPAGLLGALYRRSAVLAASLLALAAAHAVIAAMPDAVAVWIGIARFGLHIGLSQGGLASAVADLAPADRRATAFGVFHFTTGVFQLIGGAGAGWIWYRYGSDAAFATGAVLAIVAAAWMLVMRYLRGRCRALPVQCRCR